MGAAVICALLWFALWLIPFRPFSTRALRSPSHRPAGFLPAGIDSLRDLRSPSLFALPSEKGFSGTFPEAKINRLIPSAETGSSGPLPEPGTDSSGISGSPRYYLKRPTAERVVPDQIFLQETIPRLEAELPVPGARPSEMISQPKRILLFLSPELQTRADEPPQLNISGTLPPSVRIYLGIRPDGSVDQVLFDTPVENPALAGAVHQLRFKPAPDRTDSWLDLRFTPGGNS